MPVGYYNEGKWWASPFNDEDKVRSQFSFASKVTIHDATLRDGELCPFPRQCAAKPIFLQIPSMKKRMLKTEISF